MSEFAPSKLVEDKNLAHDAALAEVPHRDAAKLSEQVATNIAENQRTGQHRNGAVAQYESFMEKSPEAGKGKLAEQALLSTIHHYNGASNGGLDGNEASEHAFKTALRSREQEVDKANKASDVVVANSERANDMLARIQASKEKVQ